MALEFNQDVIDYWRPLADSVKESLLSEELPTAVFIDELPFYLENILDNKPHDESIAVAKQILATLRTWRFAGIPIVLAGSISLDLLLE